MAGNRLSTHIRMGRRMAHIRTCWCLPNLATPDYVGLPSGAPEVATSKTPNLSAILPSFDSAEYLRSVFFLIVYTRNMS